LPSHPKAYFWITGVVVQLVRIRACHARGRGFESRPFRTRNEGVTLNCNSFLISGLRIGLHVQLWAKLKLTRGIILLLGKKKRHNYFMLFDAGETSTIIFFSSAFSGLFAIKNLPINIFHRQKFILRQFWEITLSSIRKCPLVLMHKHDDIINIPVWHINKVLNVFF
jgi:hypothetical protein